MRYSALLSLTLLLITATSLATEPVDFATEILPLLSDRCALCHGPDEESRQADLRLDLSDAIGTPAQNGGHELVIAPGDASNSELIRRITSSDASEKMPPPDSNLTLKPEEIALFSRWIDDGAKWAVHWSFRPLDRPEVPAPLSDQHTTEIDCFIDSVLAKKQLAPTPPANRRDLLRRLCLDLTGLPPSASELDLFLGDPSPNAYNKLVDRLLASPAFGERLAVPWLDAARYADTYGYQADAYCEVWPWRDWVVRAFQNNLPYDQFLTWQIAGDLIPDASQESKLATAFNRLHRQTNEGGSVEEEFRAEYIADRVNTLGTAVLGLTLECARCHDHKYDPITQKNYYQLAAFFTNIDESGLYSHFTSYVPTPALDLPTEAQRQNLAQAHQAVASAERTLAQAILENNVATPPAETPPVATTPADITIADLLAHYSFGEKIDSLNTKNSVEGTAPIKLTGNPKAVAGPRGAAVELDGENGFTTSVGGDWDWYQPFTIALWIRPALHHERTVVLHRSRAWTDAASCGYELLLEDGRPSAALIHFWPGDAVRVKTLEPLPVNEWSYVCVTSDGSGKAAGLKLYVNGQLSDSECVRDNLKRTIRGGGVNELAVGSRFRDRGFKQGQVDELRLFSRDLAAAEIEWLHANETGTQLTEEKFTTLKQAIRLASHQQIRAARKALLDARKHLASIQDSIPSIMTMRETPDLHQTHILRRGQYDQPGEPVQPSLPEVFSNSASIAPPTSSLQTQDTQPPTRLDLARWLTDSRPGQRHPLVARVAVNRIWQLFFDQGIVATPEDFGLQGQPPSHPQLLDFLAATLIEENWDLKRLVRRIVTSNAYQRGSYGPTNSREKDPENKWLARGPSSRLPVETIRDSALANSGLMDRTIGGTPVKPYQPPGLWAEKSAGTYQRQAGAPSHRRSLYTIWKRTSPPPAMLIFDAPGREVCAAGRTITRSPLQSLVLLNDEQFVEAARGTAFRVLTSPKKTTEERIQLLFEILLTRPASESEQHVLTNLLANQLQYFSESSDQTDAFLAIGDFDYKKTTAVQTFKPAELAAWTIAAQTLMNLDEWVTQ